MVYRQIYSDGWAFSIAPRVKGFKFCDMATTHGVTSNLSPHRVGVVVNAVGGYSRGVIRGVSSFAQSRGWELIVEGVNHGLLALRKARFSGLIVQANNPRLLRRIRKLPYPVVNVSSLAVGVITHSVTTDDRAAGVLAADHLLRCGYRELAYFQPEVQRYAQLRHAGFLSRAAAEHVEPVLIESLSRLRSAMTARRSPLGVMAANDRAALAVLDVARQLQLRVPDDVAVIGVDNDDLAQSLASPALSTIDTARERIGFEAAQLLDRLIADPGVGAVHRNVAPRGVIVRRSTDAVVVADADVLQAARFIQINAPRSIGVDDVCRDATISRRQLERRFKKLLGRSVLDEITRCRVERARQLLIDTDLTQAQVALAAGFRSASYFSVVFKRHTGSTPTVLRNSYRLTA